MLLGWFHNDIHTNLPNLPLSTLHPIHTKLCLQSIKSSVAKQPSSTHSSKRVHQSCTNYSNNSSGICKTIIITQSHNQHLIIRFHKQLKLLNIYCREWWHSLLKYQLEALFYSWLRLLTCTYLVYLTIVPLNLPQSRVACTQECHKCQIKWRQRQRPHAETTNTTTILTQIHISPTTILHKMTACKGLSMGGCLHTRSYSESFTISVSGTGAISYIPRQIENLPKF